MRVIAARPVDLPELDARRAVGSGRRLFSGERLSALTRREREVYRGIDAGLSIREIASLLSRSEKTIQRHRRNAKAKLACGSEMPGDVAPWTHCAS